MDLELIDVRRCPDCGAYFEESDPMGLVVHALGDHPDGDLARRINAALVIALPSAESVIALRLPSGIPTAELRPISRCPCAECSPEEDL